MACRAQTITANSGTEAEFLAAVKAVTKLQNFFVLSFLNLSFLKLDPPQSAKMTSPLSRWSTLVVPPGGMLTFRTLPSKIGNKKLETDIRLIHIPGIHNPAGCLAKPIAWFSTITMLPA
jgi:hypothetical protein